MLRSAFANVISLCNIPKTCSGITKPFLCYMSSKKDRIEIFQDMKESLDQSILSQSLQLLLDLGFTQKQRTMILSGNPAVTKSSAEKLNYQLEVVRSFGFKTEEIHNIVSEIPTILNHDPRYLKCNHSNILLQLGNHQGRIAVMSSPQVLLDNPVTTNEKIDYCCAEMGLVKPVIAKSGILKCSLSLIRIRHTFAYRAGRYKKIHPKNKEGLANNPPFSDLFFCSDEHFISRFKGLSMEDYVIFEAMMASEIEDADEAGNETTDDRSDYSSSYKKNLLPQSST